MRRLLFSIAIAISFTACGNLKMNIFNDYINGEEVNKKIDEMVNNLEDEKAEKYLSDLIKSGKEWCLDYYTNGNCSHRSNKPSKSYIEKVEKLIKCAPAAKTCKRLDISRIEGEHCIEQMKQYCDITQPNETGHPSQHTIIHDNAIKNLPRLKFSSQDMPESYANAYNSCEGNQKWGYHITETPTPSNLLYYARTSKSKVVGDYRNKSDCEEARLKSDPQFRRGLELDHCSRRYVGKTISVDLFKANVMYISEGYDANFTRVYKDTISFYDLESCSEATQKTDKYLFPYKQGTIEIQISPINSENENRFISKCRKEPVVICKEGEAGFNRIKVHKPNR